MKKIDQKQGECPSHPLTQYETLTIPYNDKHPIGYVTKQISTESSLSMVIVLTHLHMYM